MEIGLVVICVVGVLSSVLACGYGCRVGPVKRTRSRAAFTTNYNTQMTVGPPDALDHLLYKCRFSFSSVMYTKEGGLDAGKWGHIGDEEVFVSKVSHANTNLINAACWLLASRLRAQDLDEDRVKSLVGKNREQFNKMTLEALAARYMNELETTEYSGPH